MKEKKKEMKYRENNLTQFFTNYLTHRLVHKAVLNATNITIACYGALNEIDESLNIAEVVFNLRTDFEYIFKVIDSLARDIVKNENKNGVNESKPTENIEYYTIPQVANLYSISQQAIRRACTEKRLPFKNGQGKNKYLIRKADVELYVAHAKGKHFNAAA